MPHYFPPLQGGLGAQYPIRQVTRYRTVVNACDLTSSLRASDPGAQRLAWWLRYQGLAGSEAAALESFFRTVRGPMDSFVFLDPEANLLAHSEDLDEAVWQKSSGLVMVPAGAAPTGTNTAFQLHATPGQSGEIWQALPTLASYYWMFSFYARSAAGELVTAFLRTSAGEHTMAHRLDSGWKRLSFGDAFWNGEEGLEAGIRLNGGASVEVTGFQLETQWAPSLYKRSGRRSGIHTEAHFSQESLRITAVADNCHQASMIITAPLPA
ncbi:MAG: hypothetical protein LC114_21200 [Bryobacterales bacterium]|nr:hypothetical protein [Bryobacterales bacterium]